jgi:adenosylcobinamide-phosphate synthase
MLGPAGAAGYRAANTLDAMVGHRSPRYLRFGWAAARLDDVSTWPWARTATAMAVLLAPLVGGRWRDCLRALPAAKRHPSPNAGLIEAAFAGALAVRLGGRNDYEGLIEERPLLGIAERPPAPVDVRRAVVLSAAIGASTALTAGLARA